MNDTIEIYNNDFDVAIIGAGHAGVEADRKSVV